MPGPDPDRAGHCRCRGLIHFAVGAKTRLSTGMTGFDSTWYHGPFAAGFFQSGDTLDLHFIAPQFLAWFYPANGEIFHAVGDAGVRAGPALAAAEPRLVRRLPGRLLVHRPALPGGAVVAGARRGRAQRSGPGRPGRGGAQRHRRDLLPACRGRDRAERLGRRGRRGSGGLSTGALAVVGLVGRPRRRDQAQLPPAGGCSGPRPGRDRPARARAGGRSASPASAALAGGGYWYLRNLVHTGNPLPWVHSLGPISLPAPDQALGGREAHSVLGYLGDGAVWSDWFLPGLHDGLWFLWPLLGAAALAGLVLLCLAPPSAEAPRAAPSPAWSASPPRSPGWSLRPPPPAPRACPAASSPASATWPRPWSSAWPCSRRRRCCAARLALPARARSAFCRP